jgi:HK97 family phage prohead protease
MSQRFSFDTPILKVDAELRQVWGYATTEVPDKQNDVVDFNASIDAFKAWPGNVREQHNPARVIGKCVSWQPVSEKKAIWVGVQLSRSSDGEDAWTKVQEGLLRGFSIGGTALATKPEVTKSGGRTLNRITKYRLDELSLVDNPACPDAMIELVKRSGGWPRRGGSELDPSPFEPEYLTGTAANGQRFALLAKSAGGSLGLYVLADGHRDRRGKLFLVKSIAGAVQRYGWWSEVAKSAAADGGWMRICDGERIITTDDLAEALTTLQDGTRFSPYGEAVVEVPGRVSTTRDDGQFTPGRVDPSGIRPRSRISSDDPVVRCDLNGAGPGDFDLGRHGPAQIGVNR